MDKKQVIFNLENALRASNPSMQVSAVCKQYLKEEIKNARMRDLAMEKYLVEIVNHYEVALGVELKHTNVAEQTQKGGVSLLGIGLTGLATISTLVTDNAFLKAMGCVAIIGGGYLIGKSLSDSTSVKNDSCLMITTTAEELYVKLSHFSNSLRKLFDHSSLETCDKEVLRWLQHQYSESKDDGYKESIVDVLEKCNYELCHYNVSIADFFDVTPGNVEAAKTTCCAIRNKSTDDYVLRGHVILPKK